MYVVYTRASRELVCLPITAVHGAEKKPLTLYSNYIIVLLITPYCYAG